VENGVGRCAGCAAERLDDRPDPVEGADLGDDLGPVQEGGECSPFVRSGQGDDRPGLPRPGRSAGAVEVVLRIGRGVVLHDQIEVGEIESTGGHVRRDEDPRPATGERLEGPLAGGLAEVSVEADGIDAVPGELADQAVDPMAGADEDERAAGSAEEGGGDTHLLGRRHLEYLVGHRRHSGGAIADRVDRRLAQEPIDEPAHGTVESGREEEALGPLRGGGEEPRDRRQEAEVGQVVGLVEDDGLDGVETAGAPSEEVLQPSRGGHEDADRLVERPDLAADRQAADGEGDGHADGRPERGEDLSDLLGEFSGRGEHEPGRRARSRALPGDASEEGQSEGERLARAGDCPTEDVPSGEGVRNRRRLDRLRGSEAAGGERPIECGGESEGTEGCRPGRDGPWLPGEVEGLVEWPGGARADRPARPGAPSSPGRRADRFGGGLHRWHASPFRAGTPAISAGAPASRSRTPATNA